MSTESSRDLEDHLKKASEECASLKEENARLKKLFEFIGDLDSIPTIVAKSNDTPEQYGAAKHTELYGWAIN